MERISLWERAPLFEESFGQPAPSLTPYLLPGGGARGAVIVCPGGGYVVKADHEGAPIAERLNELGFHAFVLDYRVAPYRHPVPLLDVQRAIRLVRHRAQEFGVLPDKIAILGFSAGGHLVCTAATHYDAGDPAALDPIDRESCRPDLFVPCYAVASLTGPPPAPGPDRGILRDRGHAPLLPLAHGRGRLGAGGEQPAPCRGAHGAQRAGVPARVPLWPARRGPGARGLAPCRGLAGPSGGLPADDGLLREG